MQVAARCDAVAGCFSYGLSPAWRHASTAQLFGLADVAHSINNSQWTLYIRNSTKPPSKVCQNTTTGGGVPWSDWMDGPFVGNGLVGGLFRFNDSDPTGRTLRYDLGRTDLWDRRVPGGPGYSSGGDLYMKPRLPLGEHPRYGNTVLAASAACRTWIE